MKLREKIKRFWTLDVHNHEGFTLVELIIVIAILAILSSVAVVGYSSYVKKANAQADKTLVADIKNTLMLAFYAGDLTEGGYIVLSANGAEIGGGSAANAKLNDVMTAAYGSNWTSTLKLKDTGYLGTSTEGYGDTSYKGNENSLLNEVDRLTGALSDIAAKDDVELGDGFYGMLDEYDVEKTDGAAVGNLAVLYVAKKTQNQEKLIVDTFAQNFTASAMAGQQSALGAIDKTYNALRVPMGDAAAMAAIYAYAEGYAQYYDGLGLPKQGGKSAVETFHEKADFTGTTSTNDALYCVMNAFGNLWAYYGNTSDPSKPLDAYVAANGVGLANVKAYVNMMDTVMDNKEVIEGNLDAEDCFTDGTVANLVSSYAALSALNVKTDDGQVAVAIVIVDGEAVLHVLPLNME